MNISPVCYKSIYIQGGEMNNILNHEIIFILDKVKKIIEMTDQYEIKLLDYIHFFILKKCKVYNYSIKCHIFAI